MALPSKSGTAPGSNPLLCQLAPPGSRLFVQTVPEERQLQLARGDADLALTRALLVRLLPYSAALWRVPYALNEDFDRMLTRSGSTALSVLHADLRRQPFRREPPGHRRRACLRGACSRS